MVRSSEKVLVFYLICLTTKITQSARVNLIQVKDLKESCNCEGSLNPNLKAEPKSLDLTLNLTSSVADGDQFIMTMKEYDYNKNQWTDGEEKSGDWCLYVQQFLLKAWDKARKESTPKITENCHLSSGTYEWKNFQLDDNDIVVPFGMDGKYQIEATLLSEDKPIVGLLVELEVNQL